MINIPKQLCDICGFVVVVEGHEQRCRPGATGRGEWSTVKRAAWFGDTIHRFDVQLALMLLCVPDAALESELQKYVSNSAMADYMSQIGVARGTRSVHALGTEFEASYRLDFRKRYLLKKFPDVAERVLSSWTPASV